MRSTLMIAATVTRLFACHPAEPATDAGRDAQPPIDATVESDAALPDSNTPDVNMPDANTPDSGHDATTIVCPLARQLPFPEVCNAFDDDCDGLTDEGACSDPCDEAW